MAKEYVMALDQGTTSSRALVFDRAGQVVALAQQEFEQIFPRSGWVEHRPQDIWSSQQTVMRAALDKLGAGPESLAALGITNQRETAVVWDRATGEPIMNAVVWQDRRTADKCEALRVAGHEGTVRRKTGLVIDAYFSATKVAWMLDNVPGARARAEAGALAFGTVDSWLLWNLTGGRVHATDVTNASRTSLYNIEQGDWDDELLALFDVPRAMLPDVRASAGVFGETDVLGTTLPIAGVAGDQQAALFGQLCLDPGSVKNTYGTGCFLLLNTGERMQLSEHKLVCTAACSLDDKPRYALEGSIFIAGAVVQWLRDGLGIISDSSEVEALAASVADNGGVYLVPAFAGLGAPHWDASARGMLCGLSRGSGKGHIARAALEGIAYQVAEVVEAMQKDAGLAISELRVDGGAARNDLLMQFQAELLGVPVVRPQLVETTAAGAAYLAGLTVGLWPNVDALRAHWQLDKRFEPTRSRSEVAALRAGWSAALERSRGWTSSASVDA